MHRRDKTLERLLDGAEAIFAERGYHAANIHEICARSKVGIGTFYAHFGHKKDLLKQLMIERAVPLPRLLSASDFGSTATLASKLRSVIDEPVSAGMWRAWHEAIEDDGDLITYHLKWRAEGLDELTRLIVDIRKRRPSKARRVEPVVVAWLMMTLARELTIHDREGAPSIETVAGLIRDLAVGTKPA